MKANRVAFLLGVALGFNLNATTPGSRCVRYAANGFSILKKARRWRVIYEGSDLPSCSLRVPRDLIRCQTLL